MMDRERPFGMMAIVAWDVLLGISALSGGVSLVKMLLAQWSFSAFSIGFAVYFFVFGIALLASALGLLFFQEWARKITIWIFLLYVFVSIAAIFWAFFEPRITMGRIVGILGSATIPVIIVIYLSRKRIKALFLPERIRRNRPLRKREKLTSSKY